MCVSICASDPLRFLLDGPVAAGDMDVEKLKLTISNQEQFEMEKLGLTRVKDSDTERIRNLNMPSLGIRFFRSCRRIHSESI